MNKIIIIALLFLTGCTTVPVERKFPEVPETLKTVCKPLKSLSENDNLSQIAKTISENYSLYHECAIKQESWIDWYNSQKKIFDGVK